MTGLIGRFASIGPAEVRRRLLGGLGEENLYGRRFRRRATEEIWRLWPALPPDKRLKAREMLWQSGVTNRLIADATRRRGRPRENAFDRLLALADRRTLTPLLSAWTRLTADERCAVLALAGRLDHPGLAALLWRKAASQAPDPAGEMARLARIVGPSLIKALGRSLGEQNAPDWAWETLVRLGGETVGEFLLPCLGRQDALGERAKSYFTSAPGEIILKQLMKTARFHPSWDVRVGAVMVLLGRKEPQALRFLTELLRDQSWYEDRTESTANLRYTWPILFGLRGPDRPERTRGVHA